VSVPVLIAGQPISSGDAGTWLIVAGTRIQPPVV
jgi:hypothetical protein